ncbi:Transposase DDE domain-containing protein [Streptomyces sp. DpondAA-D4]|nr:Transposase DDE domain-containing protein [Streptomyces sp. OspMP-M45]SCD81495.1 Transposase DDE domain-containing protein [Streptomyces sp. DpondAA-D4]
MITVTRTSERQSGTEALGRTQLHESECRANTNPNGGSVSGQARGDQPPVGTVLRTEKYAWGTPDRTGTTPACDREAYKQRNVMERCFNHLKQWRCTATRYDKRPTPADQPSPSPHS